jgi:hypothetical protein
VQWSRRSKAGCPQEFGILTSSPNSGILRKCYWNSIIFYSSTDNFLPLSARHEAKQRSEEAKKKRKKYVDRRN